jgi:hypothetical protein
MSPRLQSATPVETKYGAIIATIDRMGNTIRLGLVEEQNVVRIRKNLAPRNPL